MDVLKTCSVIINHLIFVYLPYEDGRIQKHVNDLPKVQKSELKVGTCLNFG